MRSFTIIDAPQRSAEWFAARLGRLTGSRAADMLAQTPTQAKAGTWGAARRNLLMQLVLERLTGKSQERGYVSQAMQDGIDREPDAVALYEALTGRLSMQTGFLSHTSLMVGASLDGHVGDFEGVIEVKCPQPAAHAEYLETGVVPDDYLKQITHNLWISGAQWCDWLSFNPDFPESLQTRLVRIVRDEKAIAEYEKKALAFLAEVDQKEATYRTMANVGAVLTQAVGA